MLNTFSYFLIVLIILKLKINIVKVNIKYQLGMVIFKCILLEWQPDL